RRCAERGVGQGGSAPDWECGGRTFKSSRPDQSSALGAFRGLSCSCPPMAAEKSRHGSIFVAMAILLVTNDDGMHAAGLAALAEALEPLGEVWVIAPEREQSACGHALTMHLPLRPHRLGERRFSLNGTPSDCVHRA